MFSKREGEKPTSDAITIGVPAAICGVIFLCAAIVLGTLYYRRYKKDQRENQEDAQWNKREDWDIESDERPGGHPGNSRFPRRGGSPGPMSGLRDNNSSYELSTMNTWADNHGRRN
ncbi:uncharacterized protein N7473_009118 [Penicillium subrubescens]|uniref:Uncharacterized protein n=1 Tax=Penicillium subrubescens TaxID=1316194 RepID=A0A1Q5UGB1_9EURO|nr:uncharacterized protein N7473_009118 [Penicillium subrubescens]KAJ5886444.1 hypothetical protein N7473_009118 [Penicillium subrubescens]OKP11502.1 hypothetical protein PENSUB_2988 [Penicillium subrubescens]